MYRPSDPSSYISGLVRICGKLSPLFAIPKGVRQWCLVLPFLVNFGADDIFATSAGSILDGGTKLLPGHGLTNLKYAGSNVQATQLLFGRLTTGVIGYGMQFVPAKCEVWFQDCREPVFTLYLRKQRLDIVGRFVYLGSWISGSGSMKNEISMLISKARLAFSSLKHPRRPRDNGPPLEDQMYDTTVRPILLYSCEACPSLVRDARPLAVFDTRCLHTAARVQQ